jgi:hypothetical protein
MGEIANSILLLTVRTTSESLLLLTARTTSESLKVASSRYCKRRAMRKKRLERCSCDGPRHDRAITADFAVRSREIC